MDHEIKKVDINLLSPREGNPNQLNGEGYAFLVREIEKRGMIQPILVDRDYVIIDGEHRWRVSRQIGIEEVDVVVIDVDEFEAQAALINMNQIKGEFEPSKLGVMIASMMDRKGKAELEKLLALDRSLISDLVNEAETTSIKKDKVKVVDSYEVTADPEEWYQYSVATGDIWKLDNHRLICGDSSDPQVLKRLLSGVDSTMCRAAILDPPTNTGLNYSKWNDSLSPDEYTKYCEKWVSALGEYCQEMIAVSSFGSIGSWLTSARNAGFTVNCGVWSAGDRMIGSGGIFAKEGVVTPVWYAMHEVPEDYIPRLQNNCLCIDPSDSFSDSDLHPLILPKGVMVELLNKFTNRGDIVIDPFVGSGTVFISAQIVKRSIYGVEIDPIYCNLALTRWSKATGKIPEKL